MVQRKTCYSEGRYDIEFSIYITKMCTVKSYKDWKESMVPAIGHELNGEYIHTRLQILENGEHQETQKFIRVYGLEYEMRIIGYFKQALNKII